MSNNKKILEAFSEALQVEADIIHDALMYQSIPEWDSISHMVLITELEDVFDISIDIDDVIDMSSFAKAKEIISKHKITFD